MITHGKVIACMQLRGYEFTIDFYILPISRCEIVLGASWLKSLGDILWNFEKMTMRFQVKAGGY